MSPEEVAAHALHAAVAHHARHVSATETTVELTASRFEKWILNAEARQRPARGH